MRIIRRVSLRTLLVHIFARWRLLLLAAIFGGLLAGGYKLAKVWPKTAAVEDSPSTAATGTAASGTGEQGKEKSADTYYKEDLERIDSQIYARQKYLAESLLMRLDFGDMGVATTDFYVVLDTDLSAEEEDMPAGYEVDVNAEGQPEDSVLSHDAWRRALVVSMYRSIVNRGLDWTEMAEKLSVEPQFLQELVKVENYDEAVGSFTVIARGETPEMAGEILDYVVSQLEQATHAGTAEAGNYTLRFRNRTESHALDTGGYKNFNDRLTEMNTLMQAKDSFKTNISKNRGSSQAGAVKTVKPVSRTAALKGAAKYGAAGLVAGAAAAAFLYAIWLLLGGRVLSGRELNEACGFAKIAVIPRSGDKRRALAGTADRDYLSSATSDGAYRVAGANLRNLAEAGERIALVGLSCGNRLEALRAELAPSGVELAVIEDIAGDAASLDALRDCSRVLVAAEVLKTDYREVGDVLSAAAAYGKTVIGSIVYS